MAHTCPWAGLRVAARPRIGPNESALLSLRH